MRGRLLFAAVLLGNILACGPPAAVVRIESKVDAANARLDQVIAGQQELLDLVKEQGSGEITLFFSWESATLGPEQHRRLEEFLDKLAFEAHGRTVLLASVGSAPDWGGVEWQKKLSKQRADAPRALVARDLINTPHKWVSRQGVGADRVPEGAEGGVWRQVRLIAVYDPAKMQEVLGDAP